MRLSLTNQFSLVVELVLASIVGAAADAAADEEEVSAESETALRLEIGDCYAPPSVLDIPTHEIVVNGHPLSAVQAANVAWISRCVVPRLPGKLAERAKTAALSTWWSLREGILDLSGERAVRYSNCHESGADHPRSNFPLYDCPTSIWQVGIAAGQVANFSSDRLRNAETEIFSTLDSRIDEKAVLGWSAEMAGFPKASDAYRAIVRSTGRVRKSWLLRNPLIGMMLVGNENVVGECFKQKKRWCFGSTYPATKRFARNEAAMRSSVADLETLFVAGIGGH